MNLDWLVMFVIGAVVGSFATRIYILRKVRGAMEFAARRGFNLGLEEGRTRGMLESKVVAKLFNQSRN